MSKRFDLEKYLQKQKKEIDRALDQYLPKATQAPKVLHKAMRYSVFAGGKRIRPVLALATFEMLGGKDKSILPAACALELLHTYSLIHDDLPCMDNDDLRRGKPTLHKVYGDGIAVLAGDALHALAFELLARTCNTGVILNVSQAIGTSGMIGGQVFDLLSEGETLLENEVRQIHQKKTAALISASIKLGAQLTKTDVNTLKILSEFGQKIGLAFQIVDDILNVEGKEHNLGKKVGSDRIKKKATYPSVIGLPESKNLAYKLIAEAKAKLDRLPVSTTILKELADYSIKRIN